MSLNKSSALYILLGLVSILVIFFLKFLGADKHSPIPPDPSENNIINEGVVSTPDYSTISNETDRIYQIKEMYKLINLLEIIDVKRGRGVTNRGGSIDEGEDKVENLHNAKITYYDQGFSVLSGNFTEYESEESVLIYLRDNDLFFCVFSYSAEGCTHQYRLYFDQNRNVLKMTFRQKNCEGSNNETIDILDNSEIRRIKRDMLNYKSQIEIMCIR